MICSLVAPSVARVVLSRKLCALSAVFLVTAISIAWSEQSSPLDKMGAHTQAATQDKRGTDGFPLVVKMLPTLKTQAETEQEQAETHEKQNADLWMIRLTGGLVLVSIAQLAVFILQLIVFGRQARRLKETIVKMDEIATDQTTDMRASIAQATRAASAMERVAASMAENVESIKASVATSQEIAQRQKLLGEAQMRAYISVKVGAYYPQDRERNAPLQIHPMIVNDGHTPAHDLTFRGRVVALPFPPGPDFDFSLPP